MARKPKTRGLKHGADAPRRGSWTQWDSPEKGGEEYWHGDGSHVAKVAGTSLWLRAGGPVEKQGFYGSASDGRAGRRKKDWRRLAPGSYLHWAGWRVKRSGAASEKGMWRLLDPNGRYKLFATARAAKAVLSRERPKAPPGPVIPISSVPTPKVHAAAAELKRRGVRVTLANVRRELGLV